ncbi:MAG: PorV/PorQ family protein [candidate division KSB1 bacterium]|nr:PorV/PorQ family protein [candidate division KSB1 bacterium]MDZ7335821.1 PorV/PorQ family protein [candidate division KSB1 bacterium]MDZ7356184.1 PorV/PorQ family protein [candidate division KSB1 bacterium]MDZ7400327.1 PorV/PorQ family protein [candidate division KSB1 bacterium]
MKTKFWYVFVLIITLFAASVFGSTNPASTGLSFLKIGAGSRAIAMGEAYTAVANDPSATYWNPAGLAALNRTEVLFTHNKWIQDITNEFAALGIRSGKNGFGIGVMVNTIPGIERRVIPSNEPLDVLTAHDVMFGFSYARKLTEHIHVGATLKYLYQKIYIEESSGFACDFGMQYDTPLQGMKAGLALQNFGAMSKFKEQAAQLPRTVRLGFAYQLPVQIINWDLLIAADWMKILQSTSHLNFGLESNFTKYFALRIGYQTGFADKGIHTGFGIHFHRYRLDYAYVPFASDLGDSHRISLGFGF